jgi:hypothetical protein
MTLDELNSVNVNDPAAVKALQGFLRSRGYYSGPIDGKWGGGTIEGVKTLRGDLQTQARTKLETAEAGVETEREKNSWSRFAQEFGPYGVGAVGGGVAGYGMTRKFDAVDARRADEVSRLAKAKDINPVIAENRLKTINRGRVMRAGTQFVGPAAMLGAAQFTRDVIAPNVDEGTRRYVDLAANAEQGAGIGMAAMLAKDAITRTSKVDAVDDARIRSRAAEARGDPYTVSSKAAAPGKAVSQADAATEARLAGLRARTASDLRTELRAAKLPVTGVKEDLVQRLAKLPKASLLAPFAAGAIAYDAETGDAEAAGASEAEAQGRGAVAGAGAAGATYGVMKAAPRIAGAMARSPLGRVAMRALPVAGGALAAYDIGSYVAESARPAPKTDAFAQRYAETHPEFNPGEAVMERAQARQAARMAKSDDDFDAQLAAFVQAVEEHNASLGDMGAP